MYGQEALLVWSLCSQRTTHVAFPGRAGRGARHLPPALSSWKNTQHKERGISEHGNELGFVCTLLISWHKLKEF